MDNAPARSGGDSRASVRIPIRIPATLDVAGERIMGWAVNMSLGGMFIECHRKLPRFTQLKLNARIREGETAVEIHVNARVAHSGENGMGVEFLDLDETARQIIQRTYERFLTPEAV